MSEPAWLDHVLAALYLVGLPALVLLNRRSPTRPLPELSSRDKAVAHLSNGIVLCILTLPIWGLWWWCDRPFSDLGFQASEWSGLGYALAAAVAVWMVVDTWWQIGTAERLKQAGERWRRDTPTMPATRVEVLGSLPMIVSAALCEEVIYRGFLLGYGKALLGPSVAAVAGFLVFSSAVFALLHHYQGWARVTKAAFLSIGIGGIFLATQSLLLPITLHFTLDLAMMILSPRVMTAGSRANCEEVEINL